MHTPCTPPLDLPLTAAAATAATYNTDTNSATNSDTNTDTDTATNTDSNTYAADLLMLTDVSTGHFQVFVNSYNQSLQASVVIGNYALKQAM